MPAWCRLSMVVTKCCRFRPSRSSFHTTNVSPARSALRHAASARRSSLAPEPCSS
jgi:hypothetical protein